MDLDAACRCLHCWNMNCMKYLFLLALKPFERMVSAIGGCVFSATDGLWSGTYIGDGLLPYPNPIRFQPTFWSLLFLWSWGLEATSFFAGSFSVQIVSLIVSSKVYIFLLWSTTWSFVGCNILHRRKRTLQMSHRWSIRSTLFWLLVF